MSEQQASGLRQQRFEQPIDAGLTLRGEVTIREGASEGPVPVVIMAHGFKSFMDWGFQPYAAAELARRGYYVVRFNFSCNGVNERDFDELDKFAVNTYSCEQADLAVVWELLQEKRLPFAERADTCRVALLGHSRGGGNSIVFAAEHPDVQAVVTWNGIASADLFDDAFKEEIARNGVAYVANARTGQSMPIRQTFYDDLKQNAERFDITARLAGLKTQVLSVQGDADSDRLKEGFRRLREAAPNQSFVTIEGGTHTFGAVHPFAGTTPQLEEALEATARFLDGRMRNAGERGRQG
ncbi:alpha/beta hydrolase family protein [Paenibacillus tyrfis]|uniref:alpha/beta hydrolase family protein n=1 Tax=Paenibacillus tyrfis TaxID=1501230 RepID=UPI0020A140DC|nr:alpha/beta hydrolase [Paenibacillus tyrfis]MCP1306805.1 alpha/beta hydrolase [Paenibacillus tyrfis]